MRTTAPGIRFSRALLLAAGALLPVRASAQDATSFVWANATELSFVSTGGNTSASTLGLKSALTGKRAPHALEVSVGGVRGETTTRTLTARGTPAAFTVSETRDSKLTAESYFARGRYDRAVDGVYLFGGAGWERNTFAGIQNRYALVGGLGRTWVDGPAGRLKTDLGATYTVQKDVDPAPDEDEGFGGLRFTLDTARPLSAGTTFASVLLSDVNVEDTNDLRADWTTSLTASLAARLAFKTALQLLYDRQPSLLAVPLFDGAGAPTGRNVLTPGEKVDRVLTLSLVITL